MLNKLTKDYWNKKEKIIQANVRGFNPLEDIPRMLKEAYPDLQNVVMGWCDEAELNAWHTQGWEHMPLDIFDPDEYNKSDIPSRYGIKNDDGLPRWNKNYLMIMGKDYRAKLVQARNDKSEEMYYASVQNKKYAAPEDPRKHEMLDYSESKLEGQRVQPSADSEPKRRGRPPEKK